MPANRLNSKSVLRWGLTITLGCASLFFMFSGFVTALIAAGAPLDQSKPRWDQQSMFRLLVAMLFWLISVVIFVSLRPGGALKALRGQEIHSFKRWLYIGSLIASLAGFLLSNPTVVITEFKIDHCLDHGGKWIYSTSHCQFAQAPQP